ncbi:MAG: cardiolipin synthase [Anaerostipes sp.]|uniref:cardiolipin synthase n=1 Tax=Anaerostipes sp. TaxID=1872530 RepID=UPI003995E907
MSTEKRSIRKSIKKINSFIFSRTFVILLLLLLQSLFLILFFDKMHNGILSYGTTLCLTVVTYIVIINRQGKNSYKLAALFPIMLFPVLGILLYIFLEFQVEPRLINEKIDYLDQNVIGYEKQDPAIFEKLTAESPETANLSRYLYDNSHFPVYQNTSIRYFSCGEDMFQPFLECLENAEKFIFMEYFAFSEGMMWNAILDILKRKAAEGVEIRFLYDGTCAFNVPYNYFRKLQSYGIQSRVFNQIRPVLSIVQNNRDHRKITVIDGYIAFTGGINLEDAYINAEVRYGYWKDTVILLKGDAVKSFTSMFLQNWNLGVKKPESGYTKYFPNRNCDYVPESSAGYVIPYCDSPLDDNYVGESVYIDLLYNAKKYVHIMTPYLIIDSEMITALTYAARRGIDVEIIMPGIPDKSYAFAVAKTFYSELLKAGVRIFQFKPGFLHAKSFSVDDEKAVVGTINLDYRSLYLHFECAAFFCKMDTVMDVEKDFQQTLLHCREITPEICRQEKWTTKVYGRLLRMIAPLM